MDREQLFPAPGEKVKLDLVRRSYLRSGFKFTYIPESWQKTRLRERVKTLFWKLSGSKRDSFDDADERYFDEFGYCGLYEEGGTEISDDKDGGYYISTLLAEVLRIETVEETAEASGAEKSHSDSESEGRVTGGSRRIWHLRAYECEYKSNAGSCFWSKFALDEEFELRDVDDPSKTDIDFEYVCGPGCTWCSEHWHERECRDDEVWEGRHIGRGG